MYVLCMNQVKPCHHKVKTHLYTIKSPKQVCTASVVATGGQTAEGAVVLSWDPPCAGQLWVDGRLLEERVLPPYTATGLDQKVYTYGLFGRSDWAFSSYSVEVMSPFGVSSTNGRTLSPATYPSTTAPTIGEFRFNAKSCLLMKRSNSSIHQTIQHQHLRTRLWRLPSI